MEYQPHDLRQAWLVLRSTRLRLKPLLPRAEGSATGFIPHVAGDRLCGQGWDAPRVDGVLRAVVVQHFTAFADSWDAYIDNRGWLIDLLNAPGNLRDRLVDQFRLAPLLATVAAMQADPQAPLKDLKQWGPLIQATSELAQGRERGEHPAGALMTSKYGLHPELAKAVLLHSRVEPWWAHFAITAAWLICALIFLAAVVNPHSPAFDNESVGGVGPLHYIVLPLMALAFLAAQVWLLKARPAREREWRAQLEVYLQAVGHRTSAGS